MAKLVDAEVLLQKVNAYASIWMDYTPGMSKDEIAQRALDSAKSALKLMVEQMPAVEVPSIVRCCNCYWWGRTGHYEDGTSFVDCKLGYSGDPYGYCHRGKAKYSGQVYGGEHETD